MTLYQEAGIDIDTYLENQDYGLGEAIQAAVARNNARSLMQHYNPLNLIFKDGKAIGTLVCTSEGYCAENLDSKEWLWPDEYPGEEGFYDLWDVLEKNGYKVWPGTTVDRIESLAVFLNELTA